jgi:hypothetical protein
MQHLQSIIIRTRRLRRIAASPARCWEAARLRLRLRLCIRHRYKDDLADRPQRQALT